MNARRIRNRPQSRRHQLLRNRREEQHHFVRVNQWDVSQYASQQEYDDWHLSTCSSASLAVVINYYTGRPTASQTSSTHNWQSMPSL
ncbi:hypothetical protein [Ktedonobacter racemifer]|uniref:hypothetical protein n=1 Tax=Ktedonobacter racemifer TaxID=363277 RepID=UPI00030EB73B|nr:hypothetical protein [Ktedonobacter racemifer]